MRLAFIICLLSSVLTIKGLAQNYIYNDGATGVDVGITKISNGLTTNLGFTINGRTTLGLGLVTVDQENFPIFYISRTLKKSKEGENVTNSMPLSFSYSKVNGISIYSFVLGFYAKTYGTKGFGTVFGASLGYAFPGDIGSGNLSGQLELNFLFNVVKLGPITAFASENVFVGITGGIAINHMAKWVTAQ